MAGEEPLTAVEGIVFDLDGTLVDAYEAVCRSLQHTLEAFGRAPLPPEEVKRAVGWGERALLERLLGTESIEEVRRVYRRHHASALKEGGVRPLPGVPRTLEVLRRGRRLAVATNRPGYSARLVLELLGWAPLFETVLCGEEGFPLKPAPEMLDEVLARMDLPPERAVYVGDMSLDVEFARAAGVRVVAVTTGAHTHGELRACGPDLVLDSAADLPRVLDGGGQKDLDREGGGAITP